MWRLVLRPVSCWAGALSQANHRSRWVKLIVSFEDAPVVVEDPVEQPKSLFNLIEDFMNLSFLRSSKDAVVVHGAQGATGDLAEATKIGTEGHDRTNLSTNYDDILAGFGRNDLLKGGNGDDLLLGGAGNDRLFGNAGQDILVGGDGRNKMNGGGHDDMLIGGSDFGQRWCGPFDGRLW